VRIGAKIAQYCARSAPFPIVPFVEGETDISYISIGIEKQTYDTRSIDPSVR